MKKQMISMYASGAVITLLAFFTGFESHAQVKVGDNPASINADALLEMETTNKGVLLPRVALTATNNVAPLSAFTKGMTVYNTATAGSGGTAVSEGIYYCDGTQWLRVSKDAEVNLYKDDGMLTGDRTIGLGGHDLILGGLQPQDTAGGGAAGTLVVDNSGALRVQTDSSVSAVRIEGECYLEDDDHFYLIDDSVISFNKVFDNLGEFSGHTFIPRKDGIYMAVFSVWFKPYSSDPDGYIGRADIYYKKSPSAPSELDEAQVTVNSNADGLPGSEQCMVERLVKMKAGELLRFEMATYRSGGSVSTPYRISIFKIN